MLYVVINGYKFACNGWSKSNDMLSFNIDGNSNFNELKDAFFNCNGNIFIMNDEEVIDTLEGFKNTGGLTYTTQHQFSATLFTDYNDQESLTIITDGVRPTVSEAREYRAKVEQIAENVEDKDESLDNIWAFPKWESGILYTVGKRVKYAGQLYKVILEHTSQNDWTPNIARALFTPVADPTEEWPYWIQPLGSHDVYPAGAKVSYYNKETGNMGYWISDVDANSWEPGVYGWTLDHEDTPVEPDPEPTPVEDDYPEWVQPVGAEDAYKQGDKVSHNEQHYISDVDGNVWEPGVYGWTVEE